MWPCASADVRTHLANAEDAAQRKKKIRNIGETRGPARACNRRGHFGELSSRCGRGSAVEALGRARRSRKCGLRQALGNGARPALSLNMRPGFLTVRSRIIPDRHKRYGAGRGTGVHDWRDAFATGLGCRIETASLILRSRSLNSFAGADGSCRSVRRLQLGIANRPRAQRRGAASLTIDLIAQAADGGQTGKAALQDGAGVARLEAARGSRFADQGSLVVATSVIAE